VHQQRRLTWSAGLRDRYAFGRLFASTRPGASTPAKRAFYACLALVLPPLIVARVGATVARKRRRRAEFVRALPALFAITTAWAWGELAGYLTGRAGGSLTRGRHTAELPVHADDGGSR
jgi:hypothetical protein